MRILDRSMVHHKTEIKWLFSLFILLSNATILKAFSLKANLGLQRLESIPIYGTQKMMRTVPSTPVLKSMAGSDYSLSGMNTSPHSLDSSPLFTRQRKGSLFPSPKIGRLRRQRFKRMSKMVFTTLTVLALSAKKSVASPISLAPAKAIAKEWSRPIFKALFACVVVNSVLQQIRVSRRQARDATSEWSRYANHPAARGRACLTICCKLLPFLIATKLLRFAPTKQVSLKNKSGNIFADSLLKLGPLYVKMGQIISCRENLLPDEWIKALERLQDRVPAKSGDEAMELAYAAMGSRKNFEDVFDDFNSVPLAAASLGQVHLAKLRGGNETVAVKIQRPKLRQIYDQDLVMMKKIAGIMDKFGGKTSRVGGVEQSWYQIFSDAEMILYREIDYRDEAENGIRFMRDFGIGKGGQSVEPTAKSRDNQTLPSAAPWLRAPYVYDDLSSEQVLVMEYVPSIKISSADKLEAAGVTAEDKEYLADCLARSYLRQFCANQFFSTDPHPGNLGVEVFGDERQPRLVYYDFGQAASLTRDQAEGILDVVEAIVDMDAERSVEAFQLMGVLKDNADLVKVRNKVQNNFETGKVKVKRKKLKKRGYKFKDDINPEVKTDANTDATVAVAATTTATTTTTTTVNATDSEIMSFFTLPAEYAFVARAISQMDGVGKGLDPDFDFISSAAPSIVEIKGAKSYLKDEWGKLVSKVQGQVLDFETKYGFFKASTSRS